MSITIWLYLAAVPWGVTMTDMPASHRNCSRKGFFTTKKNTFLYVNKCPNDHQGKKALSVSDRRLLSYNSCVPRSVCVFVCDYYNTHTEISRQVRSQILHQILLLFRDGGMWHIIYKQNECKMLKEIALMQQYPISPHCYYTFKYPPPC